MHGYTQPHNNTKVATTTVTGASTDMNDRQTLELSTFILRKTNYVFNGYRTLCTCRVFNGT